MAGWAVHVKVLNLRDANSRINLYLSLGVVGARDGIPVFFLRGTAMKQNNRIPPQNGYATGGI
jgi:hypothetical protein